MIKDKAERKTSEYGRRQGERRLLGKELLSRTLSPAPPPPPPRRERIFKRLEGNIVAVHKFKARKCKREVRCGSKYPLIPELPEAGGSGFPGHPQLRSKMMGPG